MSLIEKIKQGQLWNFHGGIHPPENKEQTTSIDILPAQIPDELILPLKQHIGTAGNLVVKVGDKVLKGQSLTAVDANHGCPIHAPTSGEIIAIDDQPICHPSGLNEQCVTLRPDFEDKWYEKSFISDYKKESPEKLLEHIRQMGIAGLGGAGFPSARKIQSGMSRTKMLIVNGAECEPYITADDRLMQEYAAEIVQGCEILQYILEPELTVIAIEDNKPNAIRALEKVTTNKTNILIKVIPTKYPSGGEKQLIKILTGQEVPQNGIPADIGLLMQNVATIFAIKRAVIDGEPLISRVVTLVGKRLKKQANRWVLLGTKLSFLLEKHGFEEDKKLNRLIIGGPMMGYTLPHSDAPVSKTTNCLLLPSFSEIPDRKNELACIRCSACAEVCPASLLPQQLFWYAKQKEFEQCEKYHLFDCIECGACAFVCPSEIPLVQYYRQSKAEIRYQKAEQQASEAAKLRFEAKKARFEREKAERENRHKEAAQQRQQEMLKNENQDAVAAAIARIKAKQAVNNLDNASLAEKQEIRAARKQEARHRNENKDSHRHENTSQPQDSTQDAKKSAVAAAIARAKAKKLAQEQTNEKQDDNSDCPDQEKMSQPQDSTQDAKKAAVAAAIARAKAKKLAQEQANEKQNEDKSK